MNIPEILVANGTGAVLVSFLLLLRVRGESKNSVGTALFCRILVVTLLAQVTETINFLLDGVPGRTDEDELGLTYPQIDDYLEGKEIDEAAAAKLEQINLRSRHKRTTPVTIFDSWWKN